LIALRREQQSRGHLYIVRQGHDRKKYEQQGLGLGLCLVSKLALRGVAIFSIRKGIEHGVLARVEFRLGENPHP
jgi:hypothetical protein